VYVRLVVTLDAYYLVAAACSVASAPCTVSVYPQWPAGHRANALRLRYH
jgi:hypothetical protein